MDGLVKEIIHNFGPERELVGIYCMPSAPPKPITLVFLNAGLVRRVGPNRSYVMLARKLADAGYPSFRFDLPGIGDSRLLDESKTIEDNNTAAIAHALALLGDQMRTESILLIGLCRGASEALRYAPTDTRVRGIVLIDPPDVVRTVGWYLRKVISIPIRPIVWVRGLGGRYQLWTRLRSAIQRQTEVRESNIRRTPAAHRNTWQRIVANQIDCLMIITSGHAPVYSYRRQLFRAFPGLGLEELVEPRMMPDIDHTLSTAAARKSVLFAIMDWIEHSRALPPDASREAASEPGHEPAPCNSGP